MVTVDDFIDGYVAYVHETRTHYGDAEVDAEVGLMIEKLKRDQLDVMRPYLEKALAEVWEDGWNKSERFGYPGEEPKFYENPYRKET